MKTRDISNNIRVWRADNTVMPSAARFPDNFLDSEGFSSRLGKALKNTAYEAVDVYGNVSMFRVYVADHADKALYKRGCSSGADLLLNWFFKFMEHPEILEEILIAEDYSKFVVYDGRWHRFMTFTVHADRNEYLILIQSVFFESNNSYNRFFVTKEKCIAIYNPINVALGVENIPEFQQIG